MSAKEEVGESRALVVYNGSASRINETGLQLYPVSKYDSAELGDSFEAITKLKRLASTRIFDMKERTTSSRTETQPLLSDSPIKVITCKQLSSLSDGEANNYKRVGFARKGGGGIPALPGRGPLPSDCGTELPPNGRTMIFMLRPCESLP
ncbi:hypothetical protein MTR67_026743 [Solanum verrucosum]|uniref:Uncharacterized protein n=1 Tax=Solanum verrucosum TaxID=315347 RepID=A0AAF0R2D7_SOLVR|nr:hypothetical protein MTR67_026743 [Solanum verrucosum]